MSEWMPGFWVVQAKREEMWTERSGVPYDYSQPTGNAATNLSGTMDKMFFVAFFAELALPKADGLHSSLCSICLCAWTCSACGDHANTEPSDT